LAVVLSVGEESAELGLRPDREISGEVAPDRETIQLASSGLDWIETRKIDGKRVKVNGIGDVLQPGDVVYVENTDENGWELEQVPKVSGALIAMDPYTGRVLAMVGGFSWSQSSSTAPHRPTASPARRSSRSSTPRRSTTATRRPPWSWMRRSSSSGSGAQVLASRRTMAASSTGPSTLRLGIELRAT
jgi:penicillin-binding protein 1A